MNTNKEVKIAISAGIIMITICLLIFIFFKSETKVENLDLKVYKLYEKQNDNTKHEYRECKITTDDLIKISKEYKRVKGLSDNDQVIGKKIMGNYKIISGEDYIAFDAEKEDYVYRSDTKRLYTFNSTIYEYIKNICN